MTDDPTFENFEGTVTYVDQAQLDKLKEAMIDAYMRRAFGYIQDGSCAGGGFHYFNIGNQYSGYYDYHVSYPDGRWTNTDTGETVSNALTVDVVSNVYEAIGADVDGLLGQMMQGPRPDDFRSQVGAMQYVIQHLSISGEARTSGSGSDTTIEVGDQLVPQYVSEIRSELSDLDGAAMIRLRQVYGADRIDDVMSGQHALAVVAGTLVAGEQQVWARFHRDFHKAIETATSDFSAFAVENEVSDGEVFDVVLSLADASGVLSIPEGAADLIGKASTLGGIVQGFLPDPPEPHKYTLDSGSWESMRDSFWTSVSDLVVDVEATEQAFTQCAINASQVAFDIVGPTGEVTITTGFDLKNPTEFLHAGPRGIYRDENGRTVNIRVTDNALRRVSARYEAIGDHCRSMAVRLEEAPVGDPWFRTFTAGGSPVGHFDAFRAMADNVAYLLRDNGREMHSVGERCLYILSDFHGTDDAIEAQLDRETRDVVRQARQDAQPEPA